MDEFQDIGAQLFVKAVSMLQEVQNGRRDVTANIIEHPLEREVIEIHEISERIKEQVKEITQ